MIEHGVGRKAELSPRIEMVRDPDKGLLHVVLHSSAKDTTSKYRLSFSRVDAIEGVSTFYSVALKYSDRSIGSVLLSTSTDAITNVLIWMFKASSTNGVD